MAYKVELTGLTHYFAVTDDAGSEFTVVRLYDESTDSIEYEVIAIGEDVTKLREVSEEKRRELIEAVVAYMEE